MGNRSISCIGKFCSDSTKMQWIFQRTTSLSLCYCYLSLHVIVVWWLCVWTRISSLWPDCKLYISPTYVFVTLESDKRPFYQCIALKTRIFQRICLFVVGGEGEELLYSTTTTIEPLKIKSPYYSDIHSNWKSYAYLFIHLPPMHTYSSGNSVVLTSE